MTAQRLLRRESMVIKEVGSPVRNDGDDKGNLLLEIPGSY